MDGPQDLTMLILDAPPSPDNDASSWIVAADALADAADATGHRAVVVATMPECLNSELRERISRRGLAALLGLQEGLAAIEAAATVADSCGARHARVRPVGATRILDEAAAKMRLRSIGVPVPVGHVGDAAHVLATAAVVGDPVTLKSLGSAHKSETGAVRVGLADSQAIADALVTMPMGARYLVEATVSDVVAEVLVAVRRDPPVGWLVTLGFGGVTTEVWNDVTHLLAPVTTVDVIAALGRLRSYPLLTGFRGRPAADVDALAALVVKLAEAVVGTAVVEVELNPVLVGKTGAVAVDALWIEEEDDT
jgi:acyl-CoA synthetase (NDP forming)